MSVLLGKLPPITTGRLPGGLLSVARKLDADYDVWRQGVNFNGHVAPTGGYHRCVNPADATDKDIDAVGEVVQFEPFMIYQGAECSTWMDTDELLDMARRGLASTESSMLALQLQDAQVTSNPGLADSAEVLTGGPSDVVNTFSGLITAACECGINDLVFHVNIRLIPFLLEKRLIQWDGSVWRHGPWPVVADCYSDEVVPTDEDPVAGDGSESYIYVTGPIEIAVGPEIEPYGITASQNEAVALVERLAILRFDPGCVKAARVTVS